MEEDDPAIINIMRTLFFFSFSFFFIGWVCLTLSCMHRALVQRIASEAFAGHKKLAGVYTNWRNPYTTAPNCVSLGAGGGVMTHISVVLISFLQQHCNKPSLACHDTTEQVFLSSF